MQALMYVLLTLKCHRDRIKNKLRKRGDTIFPLISLWRFPDAQGLLTPPTVIGSVKNFELIQYFMVVRVTCKNEKDPFKIEGARVATTCLPLYIDFLANSIVRDEYRRNSNSSELLCIFWSPAISKGSDQK